MDRNLGAVNTNDGGDYYQWGRKADGHQCRNSDTTSVLSTTDLPNHAKFIIATNSPNDWRNTPNNNLWQGVNGANNPCPNGYRIPTIIELADEIFANATMFIRSNFRRGIDGQVNQPYNAHDGGPFANYWSSSINGNYSLSRSFIGFFGNPSTSINNQTNINNRSDGLSVRCIQD
jgi:uncharacterized protein (TIGR02145 family)